MNDIIFFDCETTGLPLDWKAPMTVIDNWPRVIQLAWIRTDLAGRELTRGKYLIKPEGWTMPTAKFWTDNGFSQMESEVLGAPIAHILDLFIKDLNLCGYLVSHNMAFDFNVVGAEMLRLNKRAATKPAKFCTKELGTDVCKLPFELRHYNSGRAYKWPKLEELHHFLFNRSFEGAHDALADVIALRDCFFEMVKLEFIKLVPASC